MKSGPTPLRESRNLKQASWVGGETGGEWRKYQPVLISVAAELKVEVVTISDGRQTSCCYCSSTIVTTLQCHSLQMLDRLRPQRQRTRANDRQCRFYALVWLDL